MHFAKEPCNNERTSLVGGSRGIGRAVSLKLASDGYAVAVGYVSGKADGKVTVDTIVRAGGTAYPVNIDLGDPGTIDRAFVSAVERLGQLRRWCRTPVSSAIRRALINRLPKG